MLVPTGWSRSEFQTARLVSVASKGQVKFSEAFNNYFEELPEDDEDLIKQAEAFIKENK